MYLSWYMKLLFILFIYIYIYIYIYIVFANGPGDLGSISVRVIPKTPCLTLNIISYRSRIRWVNPGKGVVLSSTPWCSSYRKWNLQVTLDYGHQLFLLVYRNLYIYIYIYCNLLKQIDYFEGVSGNQILDFQKSSNFQIPWILYNTLHILKHLKIM